MNQRSVIYIILSAILLYLYYKKRDLAVFAAFIVVVGSTLILSDRSAVGFGLGGGGGDKVDSACAKMGFKEPKIDKKDVKGSLEKVMKNIEKVALKYIKSVKDPVLKDEYNDALKFIAGTETAKSEIEKFDTNKTHKEYIMNFGVGSMFGLVMPYITDPSEKNQDDMLKDIPNINKKNDKGDVPIVMLLKGGSLMLDILNKIKSSDDMKEADKDAKNLLAAAICSVKQFISIWKNIQKAYPSGGDDDGEEDDGEKKKKKSKKSKKDEDEGDDE